MIRVVISVDTEEDNWVPGRTVTIENIREVPAFQQRMQRLGVRPTYFTTHSVSSCDWAGRILRDAAADGRAEIGAHLHPWNTPPLDETLTGRNTMTKNLPAGLQARKLETLTLQHQQSFGAKPKSFRAGRFGMGPELVPALIRLGYLVDSSVTPFHSWTEFDDGPDFSMAPHLPYRLSATSTSIVHPAPDGELIELPVSAGFTRAPFDRWNYFVRLMGKQPLRSLRLVGAASRLGIVRRVLLTPEVASVSDMVAASAKLMEEGATYLHLFLHSSSLREGLSPFSRTRADVDALLGKIESYVEVIGRQTPVSFATVSEAAGVS